LGTLAGTEQYYEQALRANPQQAPLWRLLGGTRLRLGKVPEAAAAYQNALRLEPASPDGRFGLACVCREQGHRAEAIACYRRGLEAAPDHTEALLNLGVLLAEHVQVDEALEHWQRLLRLRPDHAQAHHNVGVALAQKGHLEEAVRSLEQALALKPEYAEACYNLGNVRNQEAKGKQPEAGTRGQEADGREAAVALYQRAVALRPGYIEAYHNLGSALTDLGRPAEAAIWLRQAVGLCEDHGRANPAVGRISNPSSSTDGLEIRPTGATTTVERKAGAGTHPLTPSVYNQLGLALAAQAQYEPAEACYRAALRHQPGLADAHSNLGNLFQEQGSLPEALACYELALVYEPQAPATHWNRALAWLQAGDFARGWRDYEWRWQRPQTPPRPFTQPRWDGSPLAGRTLLIYMEQGLGDLLQFIRYAELVRGGRVVVECPAGLLPLWARCRGIDRLVAEGTPLPAFDVQVPLLSLPGLCGTTLETVPAAVLYLFAETAWSSSGGSGWRGCRAFGWALSGRAIRGTAWTATARCRWWPWRRWRGCRGRGWSACRRGPASSSCGRWRGGSRWWSCRARWIGRRGCSWTRRR
jgi:tetratricopeptide (TPR) repeat protein